MSKTPKYTTVTFDVVREAEITAERVRREAERIRAQEEAVREARASAIAKKMAEDQAIVLTGVAQQRARLTSLSTDAEGLGGALPLLIDARTKLDLATREVASGGLEKARQALADATSSLSKAEQDLDKRLEDLDRSAIVAREMIQGLATLGFKVVGSLPDQNGIRLSARRDDNIDLTAVVHPQPDGGTDVTYRYVGPGFEERIVNGRAEAHCDTASTVLGALHDQLRAVGLADDGLHWEDKPLDIKRNAASLPQVAKAQKHA